MPTGSQSPLRVIGLRLLKPAIIGVDEGVSVKVLVAVNVAVGVAEAVVVADGV